MSFEIPTTPLDLEVDAGGDLTDPDDARRFGGVGRLYGDAALAYFKRAHVVVIGVGGVGSWAAEALARSAIGQLTLIDLDHVAESNTNRQLHALDGNFGKAKVEAMQARIQAINPRCRVNAVDDFVEPDNLETLLAGRPDFIVDAIDNSRTKTALIAWCARQQLALITVGSAGGQVDPTRIRVDDLARTIQDPLLAKVRAQLRRQHGFPKTPKARFGVAAVYSDEPLQYPAAATGSPASPSHADSGVSVDVDVGTRAPMGLSCMGFGSSVCVTAAFGLAAASRVLMQLAKTAPR